MTNSISWDLGSAGDAMHALVAELFPICRSITGPGVRETLRRLQQHVPLMIREVPTGTTVFDWEVPQEWEIRDAYIKDDQGERIVDFRQSNLHVVSGSVPIQRNMCWSDLKGHLHSLPDQPELIPYRTSFHQESWGFCLPHRQFTELAGLGDRQYEVCIDSTVRDGSLTYGEWYLPGTTTDEVLFSCHVCHPSLANDNLSGIAVATYLAQWLGTCRRRYSYRVLFIPATIGAITWLSQNEQGTRKIKHGLILTLLGDPGDSTYKRSRQGDEEIDRAVAHVLRQLSGDNHRIVDFEPIGYDERQFCSPGFDLPVGCLMRTPNGQFPEYHTSADDLQFVQPEYLADSLQKCIEVVKLLEGNRTYVNQNPKCEPRLGRRGLYRAFGCAEDQARAQHAILWVLNLSDGQHSLLDIAERSGFSFESIHRAADMLCEHGLLREQPPGVSPVRVAAGMGNCRETPSPIAD